MKIMQIISSSNIGGSPKHTLLLCKELTKLGHECILIYPPGGSYEFNYQNSDLKSYPISMDLGLNPGLYRKLIKIVDSENIHLIHTHEFKSDFIGYWLGKLTHKPVISTIHNMITHSQINYFKKKIYCLLSKTIYNSISCVIAVSEAVKDNLINELKIKQEKVVVILNGTEEINLQDLEEPFKVRNMLGVPEKSKLLICAGRLIRKQKGYEYLIKAMADIVSDLPSVHLLIVGDGPMRQELELLCRESNLGSKVTFCGWKNNISEILYAGDICIVPSLWDPLPRIVLEAMMVGKPVIGTDVDGIREAVINHQTGILVPPANSPELANAIINLVNQTDLYKELGKNGRKIALEKFTSRYHAEQTLKLYLSCFDNN